jgi:uncharacterized membrane protein required for colicin V production
MEIISRINWVDVLVIILMLRISYGALKDGLSHEIFPLAGALIILLASLKYYKQIGLMVSQSGQGIPLSVINCCVFIVLAAVAGFLLKFIKILVDKIIKVTWHPAIEKIGGLMAGMTRASVVICIVLTALSLSPFSYLQRSIRDRSVTGMFFLSIGPSIYSGTIGLLPEASENGKFAGRDAMISEIASDKSVFSG